MNIDTVKAQENLDEPEKAFELDNVAVRLVRSREPLVSDEPFSNPDSVVRALSEQMRDFDREVLGIINLDSRMRPINVSFVSAGAVNGTLSHPREILKAAILSNAASMMLIHNHPSGYLIPGKMDVQMTDRMIQLCDMVNIPLMDHIIVGGDKEEYFSFSSQKVLPEADNYFTENYLNLEFTMRPERQDKELPDDYNGLMPVIEEPQAAYNREDRVKEITQQLEDGIKDMFTSEKYMDYLNTMSKFHGYSLNNTLLIAAQNPKASLVAGFKSWEKNFDRHVKRGEKGIKILAPSPYTKKVLQEKVNPDTGEMILDKNGNPVKEETEIKLTSFRVVSVFDVSQTEGKELPSMAHDLQDNIKDYPLYIQALEQVSDVPIAFEEINGSAHGYYSHATDSIAIQSGMSESQTLKTMIHEIAHSILHNDNVADAKEKDRQTKEVEAESVAYTVCKHFGIDSSDYSFGYIAGWSADKELNELKSSLETIRKTSSGLITGIEDKLEKLRLNKEISVSEQPLENVTESVTLQQSKDMMSAALGSTDELLSAYKNKDSGPVTESVTVVAEERAEYNNKLTVKQAIENRQHTHYGAYADIGTALDKFSTDELIDYLRKNEPGGEGSLRGYVESQIIGAQINRERYQSENNFVTESVTEREYMFTKNKVQISTYMVLLIPFVLLGIFASGLFSFSDLTLMNIGDKVMYLLYHIWEYKRFFNEKTMMCIGWSVILWVFLCSYIMYHFRDFHSDIQNGSEEWADPYEVTKRRANPDDSLNRIISKNVKISTQGEGAPSNNNMVVVGSSGKYKTTSIVITNTLNSSANQITLDVKGEIMYKLGLYITKIQHKTIRCLNLKYPELSDRYNPFAYIECEEDIINLIENIYDSLTPPDAMVNDPFWPEGAKLYLQSLFYYEWWYAKKEGRKGSINNILILINDETKKDTTIKVQKGQQPPSYLQLKMDKLAKEDSPDNPAVRDYRKLKDGAAETVRSIIIIVNAKLKLFETAALKRIFEDDDMNLREFGTGVGGTLENPTNNRLVLFICVDDREKSFHFIASMLYTQVLTILCRMADDDFKENGGALPIPLEMLLDEFYAGAKPSNTVELMGVIRSRNISMIPILQSTSQLKDLFKAEKAEIIYDNVPVLCFCGAGQGAIESHKYISELLGKATIDTIGDGKHGSSYNSSYNKAGRELMTPQEIKRMDKKHCIIFMEDEYPIYDRKALPWEDKGASRKEIRRCKRLHRKNPNIQIPSRKSKYQIAMELNEASKDKGYVPAPKSMIDPHTGIYVTINSNPPIEETSELPDNALVIDMTSEEFLYQKLGDNDTEDDITAAVSEEIKRLYELDRQGRQQMKKPARKTIKKATENVTDSVTSAGVPATIEDGVVMYFNSFTEEQKELINKAIVKKMPDIFIRQMFTMGYNDMKEFFDSYYNE